MYKLKVAKLLFFMCMYSEVLSCFVSLVWAVTRDVTTFTADGIPTNRGCQFHSHSDIPLYTHQEEEMASQKNFCAVHLASLLVTVSIAAFFPVDAASESTKTVEFNVKPGGVVHTFTEGIVSDVIKISIYLP